MQEPGVARCHHALPGHVAAQPGHLRCREVRVERKPGGARQGIGRAGHVVTDRRGPAVLPGDGGAQGAARLAIPGQDRLALIGEADGRDALPRPGDGLPSGLADRFPQLLGVLFDAAARNRLRRHGGLDGGHHVAVLAEDHRLGGGGPLVDGEDLHRARSMSGIGWAPPPAQWRRFPHTPLILTGGKGSRRLRDNYSRHATKRLAIVPATPAAIPAERPPNKGGCTCLKVS